MSRKITSIQEGFLWMESLTNMEKSARDKKRAYRLERMVELCRFFGNPQKEYSLIHLAGSKGKGSTAAMISSILTEKGEKTGLYTSPHLTDYRERIQIIRAEGELPFASDDILLNCMNHINDGLLQMESNLEESGGYPTTFELLTLLAFLVFKEEHCSYVVLETGLGGRLDATNVCHPLITLITPIEKEHCEFLGNTLEEIAAEKGGIIKENIPVLVSYQKKEVLAVLQKKAQEKKAPLIELNSLLSGLNVSYEKSGLMEVMFDWNNNYPYPKEAIMSLVGPVQAENAALAIGAVKQLFPALPQKIIKEGLRKASLPGRSQIVSLEPLIMLDGAHTPRSIEAVKEAFLKMCDTRSPRILIFGCAIDKDARSMAKILSHSFDRIIISRPGTFKKSNPSGTADIFREFTSCDLMEDSQSAVQSALTEIAGKGALLVTGSFYLAGEVFNALP
jgi:dihydrofolate synthase / folylpolyglutamate synthase